MDLKEFWTKVDAGLKRYRYPILIVILGLVLMWLPTRNRSPEQEPVATVLPFSEDSDLASELSQILSQIEGVGKVKVMLTVSVGESTIYQTDDAISDGSVRKDTVIIKDSDRNDRPLILQTLPPEYRGAIIVCQGGDKASVKLAVLDAVAKATGLSAECISVLKMK